MNSLDLDPSSSSDEDEILCDYWNRKVMSRKLQYVTQGEETDYSADVESVTTLGSTRSVFVPATGILGDSNSTPSAVVYDVPTNGKQGVARLHVISAEIPRSSKLRNTLYQNNNNKPLGTSLSDASGPASSSDEDSIEVPTWGWMLLKKKLRSLCRLTPTNTENTAAASSNQSLTDGFPKPPLLPRQNSNPLGLLPAPPRPKALKPSKTSPSPLLHRATPFSEKSYDSVCLSSLVNRPLPPVPTTEDVYADVNFHEEPQPHELSVYPWFHDVEREDVEKMLREIGEQGCFLVRVSRRGGASKPYTLSLLHDSRIFHLHIRKRPEGTYALGSEKPKEKVFENVSDLIEFHRQEEILLTSRNQSAGSTRLTETHHV